MRRVGRELAHLLRSVAVGLTAAGVLLLTLLSLASSPVLIGLPMLVGTVELTRRLAGAQRRRCAPAIESAYRPLPADLLPRARAILTDAATWRDLAWLGIQSALGLLAIFVLGLWLGAAQGILMPLLRWLLPPRVALQYQGIDVTDQRTAWLVVPIAVLVGLAAFFAPRLFVAAELAVARRLLAPTAAARLSARVEQLAETRAAAVDASAAELRRIERDLHDGAQARLVALTMNLGMAEAMFDSDPDTARAMLADARAGARTAMSELRDLVRGIHPPLLADRGLPGALHALTLASSIPVDLDLRLDRRLPAPVESAAYFVLAEALANAIKHAAATRITLSVTDLGARLSLRLSDDGRGGADPAHGTGLRGIARRLAAFDGTLRLTSPAGGPTVLEMELPCGS